MKLSQDFRQADSDSGVRMRVAQRRTPAGLHVQSVGLQVNKAQVNLGAQVKRFHYPSHVARDSIDVDSRFWYQVNILF